MSAFLTRFAPEIKGVLSGFDRVRFRGTLRWLANLRGLSQWLWRRKVLLKEFKPYAMDLTEQIRKSGEEVAEQAGRPVEYLYSSSLRKDEYAKGIAQKDGVTDGLVCVLTAVEPCQTFTVGPNRERKKLELRAQSGKCLHQYFYLIDRELGWLNVRVQTWFPFTVSLHGAHRHQRTRVVVAQADQKTDRLPATGQLFCRHRGFRPGTTLDGSTLDGSATANQVVAAAGSCVARCLPRA